jgi:hypothetical protein
MIETKRLSFCFGVVSMALLVQGCWEEDEQFSLLGSGGCRTTDDRQGAYTTISGLSLEECRAQCSRTNGRCTAIEFRAEDGNCELHSDPITKFEPREGVACYAAAR